MLVDISYQKKAEEQHNLLVRELHHRVKNTLATVQAIMSSTIRFADTMEDFQQSFVGRIGALSKTHSLLTEDRTQRVSFKTLLCNELEMFDDGKERLRLVGKEVLLPAHLAVPVGMAIHELTTNAAKYGALAMIGGTLRVQWHETDDRLTIDWREENVPDVREPERAGFGSQLLKRVLPQQIGAKVDIAYEPGGLHGQFIIPLGDPPY
jgi:two-component sensor histidine kinase